MKDPLNRTKVVLRHLPASVPQQAIIDQIEGRFDGRFDWVRFHPGKNSTKHPRHSRVYINFKSSQDVVEFAEFFNGRLFVNEKGAQFKALVEYAPAQRIPKSGTKKDGRDGTIGKDADYLEFLEQISKPIENLPSAEIQLERKEAEKAGTGKEAPIVTPLMFFIRQRRAAKVVPQRTIGSISSRMASGRASKRPSERRRGSSSSYVMKEGLKEKEKPMYILASRREEQINKEDKSGVQSLVNNNATPSGSLVGSSVEPGKGKIILLKSKGKEVSQSHDVSTPLQNTVPTKASPVQGSSARVVRGTLTNKDARGPSRQNNGDERDERFSPASDRMERSSRSNRDRPDRSMWAPRNSDRNYVQGLSDAMEKVSIPGNGERKPEIRNHGGPRGSTNSMENGSQRNNNRRGPPRIVKETDASILEGKNSKRGGPSGFSSQEKQVWVQKSGSAS